MIFDPLRRRAAFLNDEKWLLRHCCEEQYEKSRPMGNVAVSQLEMVISGWLVGLQNDLSSVIPISLEWLDLSIAADEKFGDNFDYYRYNMHQAKAFGIWMQNARHIPEIYEAARHFYELAVQKGDVWSRTDMPRKYLDDYLALCYQAGQYEAGIAEFEKYHGAKVISLKKTLRPREVGYALCRNALHQEFDADALFQAGRKMLQSHLQEVWLGSGQNLEAATWLKIVYWHHDPTLTPLQTILSAYENMPDVTRPDFAQ